MFRAKQLPKGKKRGICRCATVRLLVFTRKRKTSFSPNPLENVVWNAVKLDRPAASILRYVRRVFRNIMEASREWRYQRAHLAKDKGVCFSK